MARALIFTLGLLVAGCGDAPLDPDGTPAEGGSANAGAADPGGAPSHGAGGIDAGGAPGNGGSPGSGGAAAECAAQSDAAGDFDRTVSVDGSDRRFLLHVPASYVPGEKARLVIAMHGFTEGPEEIRDVSHFDEVADERGFIVAYPEGTSGSWNGGTCCGVAMFNGQDDVAFISSVIDAVSADYCVDPERVHATGFSNGGFMAHRLACELSDRIRSVGVVAGQESLPDCTPTRPVPVLQVHGDADPVVPFDGNPLLGFPSTESTITGWAERDGCTMAAQPTESIGDATCEQYAPCDASASVELCTVAGGGHDWPGGGSLWTDAGPPDGFVATLKIIDFFEAHDPP